MTYFPVRKTREGRDFFLGISYHGLMYCDLSRRLTKQVPLEIIKKFGGNAKKAWFQYESRLSDDLRKFEVVTRQAKEICRLLEDYGRLRNMDRF